jgi:hypothetical protein
MRLTRLTLATVAQLVLPRATHGHALSPSERRTLVRVADVLMKGGPHGVAPEDIAKNVERFLVLGRSRRAWRVRILLRAIELSSIPRFGRRFSELSVDERRALIVETWIPGRGLGRIFAKVKNLVVLGAYADARAEARTGYVPVHRRKRFLAESAVMRSA